MKMKLYLAARYGRKEELNIYKEILEYNGFIVTSSWLLGTSRSMDDENMSPVDLQRVAMIDYKDLLEAEGFVAFTEPENNTYGRGGRHVELGIALEAKKDIAVVGYRENIFCWHPGIAYFPTPKIFLSHLCQTIPEHLKNYF